MRRRTVAAAALLAAVALAAGAACKPSSLTPFGIGRREPLTEEGSFNGSWSGVTSSGGALLFSVANNEALGLVLVHREGECAIRFPGEGEREPIDSADSFRFELFPAPQGRLVLTATFSSTETVGGSYFFEALASAPPCPTAGSGTFVASKER